MWSNRKRLVSFCSLKTEIPRSFLLLECMGTGNRVDACGVVRKAKNTLLTNLVVLEHNSRLISPILLV